MRPNRFSRFDGDKAGLRAAWRAVERVLPLLKPGHSLRFALLPEGKDPDDLVREEGSAAMRAVLDAARPLAEMVWEKEVAAGTWDTPERRAALETRIEAVIGMIGDQKVRRHYAEDLRGRIARMFGRGETPAGGQGGFARNSRPFGSGNSGGGRPWRGRRSFGAGAVRSVPPVAPGLRRSATASGTGGGQARRGAFAPHGP